VLVPLGDASIGKMFREHVKANAVEIGELLKTVVA
jgi:hypothetical protein